MRGLVERVMYRCAAAALVAFTVLVVGVMAWLLVSLWTPHHYPDPSDLPTGCARGHSEWHDGFVVGMCDDQEGAR